MRDDLPRLLGVDSHTLKGVRRVVQPQVPAAGGEWSVVVPGGRMWRPIGGRALLSTSAAVANRLPGVAYTSEGVLVYVNGSTAAIAANANNSPVVYELLAGGPQATAWNGRAIVPLSLFYLVGGDTISSDTSLLQAADQYSAVQLVVEEVWFDNADLRDHIIEERRELARLIGGEIS